MAGALDAQRLAAVFQSRPDIIEGIKRAADSPGRVSLFNDITSHVYDQIQEAGEPAHKRRRVEVEQANGTAVKAGATNAADEPVLLEVKEISVSVPQRKKFELCFTDNHLYARAPGTTAPVSGITYAWKDFEYAFYLPVPEKTQVQHNYVLFPRGTCLPSKTNPPALEPLVFTVPATAPKPGTIGGSEAGSAAAVSDTYKTLIHWALERRLKSVGNAIDIVSADPNKFHSMVRQAHRPNEKAVHIGGFRGSKDGYLFFLENGILWGYKKPLIFIPLNRVVAISYTNILQITFNMVVEVFGGEGEACEELEFGMLDQQDFGGIDEYVKSNRLQDRSMAEQRKAKLELAENKTKKNGDASAEGEAAGGEDMTELARAQFEVEGLLQDDEDEDEEDYDPGSDAESDGSGESSEEDSDDDDDDDDDDEGGEEEENGDGEEEEDGDAEEGDVKQEPVKEEVVVGRSAPAPPRRGWAAIGNSRPKGDMDVDEKFDVV